MEKELKEYGWILTKIYSIMMKFSKDTFVIDEFKSRISNEKKILEIGSGTGKDYQIHKEIYEITGSDYSDEFLKMLHKKFKGDEFLKVNALTMDVGGKYDVIYSNKVLHHLLPKQLEISFGKQYEILNDGGILFHTMWLGNNKISKPNRIPDTRYNEADILRLKGKFKIVDFIIYTELVDEDSFLVILKKEEL